MSAGFTIHQGDALDLLLDMPSDSVDGIITDPPYSSGGMFRGDRAKKTGDKYVVDVGQEKRPDFFGDTRDQYSFGYWCSLWLSQCLRVAKEGALLAVFTDWRQLPIMTQVVQAGGWCWRGLVPWNKTEASRPVKGWFRSQCEYLVVAAKGKPALLDHMGRGDAPCLPGFFVCPVDREGVEHQTQKPVDLMRWLVQVTPPQATILDPFCGSGTTGVGAIMEGRSFVGFELSEHFAEVSRSRCAEAQSAGQQASLFGVPG